jgi:hypothetical protein
MRQWKNRGTWGRGFAKIMTQISRDMLYLKKFTLFELRNKAYVVARVKWIQVHFIIDMCVMLFPCHSVV